MALPAERQPRFSYYKNMQEFFSQYHFHEYEPVAEGARSSSGYLLRRGEDQLLLLKSKDANSVRIRKPEAYSSITVKWFNPVTGEYSQNETFAFVQYMEFRSPYKDCFSIAVIKLNH